MGSSVRGFLGGFRARSGSGWVRVFSARPAPQFFVSLANHAQVTASLEPLRCVHMCAQALQGQGLLNASRCRFNKSGVQCRPFSRKRCCKGLRLVSKAPQRISRGLESHLELFQLRWCPWPQSRSPRTQIELAKPPTKPKRTFQGLRRCLCCALLKSGLYA